MVKTKREYIFASCVLSGIAAILSLVSLGSQEWVTADVRSESDPSSKPNKVNYGLFTGTYEQNVPGPFFYQLSMTCLFSENVCAYLCGSPDSRDSQLLKLHKGEQTSWDQNCPQVPRMYRTSPGLYNKVVPPIHTRNTGQREFFNAGIWLCTIIFLVISSLFGVLSAALSLWNTISNPVEVYFSVSGLYVYNAISCATLLLAIILWGSFFASDLTSNICFFYTITEQMTSKNMAELGFSYWILLPAFFLYGINICILYVRHYLINQEPKVKVHIDDSSDPVLYLY